MIITDEMIKAGEKALSDHTDRYFDGSEVVGSGAVQAIFEAMSGLTTRSVAVSSDREARLAELISDEEIIRVHGHANFGTMTPREVVNDGLLKSAVGYHCGHTQFCILREHGLITKPRGLSYDVGLTKKGKRYAQVLYLSLLNQARNPEGGGEPVAWRRPANAKHPILKDCWELQPWRTYAEKEPELAPGLLPEWFDVEPLYAHPAHEAGEVERLRGVLQRLEAERMRPDVTAAHLKRAIAVAWAEENKPQGAQQ